jgi:hypothetical protein
MYSYSVVGINIGSSKIHDAQQVSIVKDERPVARICLPKQVIYRILLAVEYVKHCLRKKWRNSYWMLEFEMTQDRRIGMLIRSNPINPIGSACWSKQIKTRTTPYEEESLHK